MPARAVRHVFGCGDRFPAVPGPRIRPRLVVGMFSEGIIVRRCLRMDAGCMVSGAVRTGYAEDLRERRSVTWFSRNYPRGALHGPGRGIMAQRRSVGVLEPDVPEYRVDDRPIGDERDDPHGAAAPRTEQWVMPPDHPDESRPADTPASEPRALVTVGAVCPADGRTESAAGHPRRCRDALE